MAVLAVQWRTSRLGFKTTLARTGGMGFTSAIARKRQMGFNNSIARTALLVFNEPIAPLPYACGWIITAGFSIIARMSLIRSAVTFNRAT